MNEKKFFLNFSNSLQDSSLLVPFEKFSTGQCMQNINLSVTNVLKYLWNFNSIRLLLNLIPFFGISFNSLHFYSKSPIHKQVPFFVEDNSNFSSQIWYGELSWNVVNFFTSKCLKVNI